MKRDEEINRLIRYAQGLGLSVRFKPYVKNSGDRGGWTLDGSEITVHTSLGDSKISKILTLIHELSHHRSWIDNNRQVDPKVEEALNDEEEKKRSRKRIYLDEMNDAQYWEQIYKDTDCKFDINKLYRQKELDVWKYEVYYETSKFPTREEERAKIKALKEKYRK